MSNDEATARPATGRRRAIEQWLRARVAAGRPGDALPSEADLAARFDVSRMTARQAVQSLAAEGLVRRQRGSGTYIAPPTVHRHSGPLMSFTEDVARRGMVASSRLLVAEMRAAADSEVDALRVPAGSRIVSIERLRLADGTPFAVEYAALVPDVAGVLASDLEAGSLHEALRSLGRTPTRARARISARTASARESELLDMPRRAAVLQETRAVSDGADVPIELTTTVYAADRYDIDALLSFTA